MDPSLYKVAKSGDVNLLKQLLGKNPGLLHKVTPQENTALHVAVRFGHKDFAVEVYNRCPSLLMQANVEGDTPLHIAARVGCFPVAEFLVSKIISTSPPIDVENGRSEALEKLRLGNRDNNTALHEAVRYCHVGIVKLLITADPELSCFDNITGESPLYLAALNGSLDIVNEILLNCKSSAHGGPNYQTALHVAILQGHFDIVEKLLRRKPQLIQEVDTCGKTPLHYAASFGDHKMVRPLLQFDTFIAYLLDKDGLSPIHIAAHKGHSAVIKEIIQCCPDSGELLDINGRNALHFAVMSGKVGVVRYILETIEFEGLINQADNDGNTPFHLATMGSQSWIKSYFLWDKRVNKRATNKSYHAVTDIDETISTSITTLPKDIIMNIRQQFRSRAGVIRDTNPESDSAKSKQGEEEKATALQSNRQMGQTLLMVATLITTVTFAAVFTMPGGYNNETGITILKSSKNLELFVLSDTVAMACSITAASLIFFGTVFGRASFVYYIKIAIVLTLIALHSAAIAFSSGVIAVLPNKLVTNSMAAINGCIFHVSTFLFLFQIMRILCVWEVCQFLISRLCKFKKFKLINR